MHIITPTLIKKRIALVCLFIAFSAVCLAARMAYLQIFHSSWLKNHAMDQRLDDRTIHAKRGTVYDRTGKTLAVSTVADSVYAEPDHIKNPEETAAKLAAILQLDAAKLAQRFTQGGAFTWVKRIITPEQSKAISALELEGVGLTQESKRYYPNGNLAAHVLGFVGIDNQGLAGIELAFEQYLKGIPGRIVTETDPGGRQLPDGVKKIMPSQDGQDLVLTIDQTIQFIVERKLDKAMRDTQAKAAAIVAMNPKTGEILALASRPDYKPETYDEYSPIAWRNNVISNVYEPGSVFKIVTASAALQEQVATTGEQFVDPGYIEVQGNRIYNWDGGDGSEKGNFVDMIKKSSNYALISLGMRLGPDRLYQYIDNYGFGKKTNVDLPGEEAGVIIPKNEVRTLDWATMCIGQSIAVTPLQLLTAVSAVANDGVLMKPQIVKEIRTKDGKTIKTYQPEAVRQAISLDTAQQMRYVLEKVVSEGGASKAAVPGYRFAGKTGTAQVAGPGGYEPGKYVASFVGFGPLDEAPIAMAVVLFEPKGAYYGGQVAAPIFSEIMREVVQYYNIFPAAKPAAAGEADKNKSSALLAIPNCLNLTVAEATRLLQANGFSVKTEGGGERVTDVSPGVGSLINAGGSVTLYAAQQNPLQEGETWVPYVQGKTIRETGELLSQAGLSFYPIGSGIAIQQEPAFGTKLPVGSTVTVYFANRPPP